MINRNNLLKKFQSTINLYLTCLSFLLQSYGTTESNAIVGRGLVNGKYT